MYEIEISNLVTENGVTQWVTQKVHESDQQSTRRVKACTFSRGVSMIQAADFQLLATNPAYNEFHEHTTLVRIINKKTGKIAFDGYVAKVYSDGMDSSGVVQKSVSCDGCLSFLNESIQVYRKFDNVSVGSILAANGTGILAQHNAMTEEWKHITLGVCEYSDALTFECKYESTLECIKKNILDVLPGAEISIRRNQQGGLLLDILDGRNATKRNTEVKLADNMVSMAMETDASHIVTRLIPLGAYIETTQTIDGKQKKVRTNERYNISSAPAMVPDLDPSSPTYNPVEHVHVSGEDGKIYIDDVVAIGQYGVITGTVAFDDLVIRSDHQSDDAAVIMNAGKEYLLNNNRIKKSYKAEVLELSTIGLVADELEEGYIYTFTNRMIPINEDLRIQKITVDIFKAHRPTIEIGDKAEKITDVGAKQAKLIEYELPEQSIEFLDAAREVATANIANATQGQVYIEEGDYSQQIPGEILIMDNPEKLSATRVWRWNLGGFGYSPNGYNGPYINAMTIDGSAVHDFVMAGSVEAQNLTITGGKIDMQTSSENYDLIYLSYTGVDSISGNLYHGYTKMQPWRFETGEVGLLDNKIVVSFVGITGYYGSQDQNVSFNINGETGEIIVYGNGTAGGGADDNRIRIRNDGIFGDYGRSGSDIAFSLNSETGTFTTNGSIVFRNGGNSTTLSKSWVDDRSTATNTWAQGIGVMLNEHDTKIQQLWNAVFPS